MLEFYNSIVFSHKFFSFKYIKFDYHATNLKIKIIKISTIYKYFFLVLILVQLHETLTMEDQLHKELAQAEGLMKMLLGTQLHEDESTIQYPDKTSVHAAT